MYLTQFEWTDYNVGISIEFSKETTKIPVEEYFSNNKTAQSDIMRLYFMFARLSECLDSS